MFTFISDVRVARSHREETIAGRYTTARDVHTCNKSRVATYGAEKTRSLALGQQTNQCPLTNQQSVLELDLPDGLHSFDPTLSPRIVVSLTLRAACFVVISKSSVDIASLRYEFCVDQQDVCSAEGRVQENM